MEVAEAQAHAVFAAAVVDVMPEGQAQHRLEGLGQTPCFPVMAGQIEGRSTRRRRREVLPANPESGLVC